MRAMKHVADGLPMSYMSNHVGFEGEGDVVPEGWSGPAKYQPLPFYKKLSGEAVIRWELTPADQANISHGRVNCVPPTRTDEGWWGRTDLVEMLKVAGDPHQITDVFLEGLVGPYITTGSIWNDSSLTEKTILIRDKTLYQTLHLSCGGFEPVSVSGSCPFSVEEEIKQRALQRQELHVTMGGSDMVPAGGVGNISVVVSDGGTWRISGYEGLFSTENEAISAVARELRSANQGQWHNFRDMGSLSGGEPEWPVLLCPDCKVAIQMQSGKSSVTYGTVHEFNRRFICPKCHEEMKVRNWYKSIVEIPKKQLFGKAVAAGFTQAQAELLWALLRKYGSE